MKIIVLDGATLNPGDNPWDELSQIGDLTVYDRTLPEQVLERAKDANILLTNKAIINGEILAQLPELKLISVLATGYNIVDVAAAQSRGITVCNVPEYGSTTVAQFAFSLLLELCHHVGQHSDCVHRGGWQQRNEWSFSITPQIELAELTVGIFGYGRIGSRVGQIAHGFGMTVLATGNRTPPSVSYSPFEFVSQNEILERAHVITLHCPLTHESSEMVNDEFLGAMRPGAMLINTSRGGLVDERALRRALESGQLAGAALDVVSSEPILADNPLLNAPNCIITPHMAWSSLAARRRLMQTTMDNVRGFLSGTPINAVAI